MSAVTIRYLRLRASSRFKPLQSSRSAHTSNQQQSSTTLFAGTSQPRPYSAHHSTPKLKRDLPRLPRRWPFVVAFSLLGLTGWAGFMTVVTNQEKITSSVFKQVMRTIRNDSKVYEMLGDAIRPQSEWWLNGDPNIKGQISTMQGNVDMSFRVKGSKGSGTVYFTSIRREKGVPFTILRFKVIGDDGSVIHIESAPPE
ncbi:hypothetical protein E1B28_013594 [Marasmius oreades]|uniref:DUF1783-domain-containing protein n=1 Tax=Marasmius oreades TaxID=181124 RepID=A0A9P7UP62_9AGAR|nr:uncharacterized protein E1B28_013594 [Marasmius oreades]KAG7087646.1 hypothetical protein E1B28_013594 [Marasmius oreades]